MTPQNPLQGEPSPLPGSVPLNRFQAVGTAGGCEATTGADHRRDETAVEADQSQHQRSDALAEALLKGWRRIAG